MGVFLTYPISGIRHHRFLRLKPHSIDCFFSDQKWRGDQGVTECAIRWNKRKFLFQCCMHIAVSHFSLQRDYGQKIPLIYDAGMKTIAYSDAALDHTSVFDDYLSGPSVTVIRRTIHTMHVNSTTWNSGCTGHSIPAFWSPAVTFQAR